MDSAKQQLVEKLKDAKNVLVTVSRNPDVDQLAALIGLALIMNKQGKHCAAVFSGNVPSTLEFLKPEETIEKNTDSLRDFIIALDKSKADKLRYKVEDDIVRIFITPYRTSINQDDLEFSQGDFNVDVVVALGVHQQTDLDDVITAHGRILHDAVVASLNISNDENVLGSIDWHNSTASSLSEMVTDLSQSLGDGLLDEQIATALLTGIVSQTDRFSNDKTTPTTMSVSSILMAAGANQQLVATKLEEPLVAPESQTQTVEEAPQGTTIDDDGTLNIQHQPEEIDNGRPAAMEPSAADPALTEWEPPIQTEWAQPAEMPAPSNTELPSVHDLHQQPSETDAVDTLREDTAGAPATEPVSQVESTPGNKLITEPPTLGGTLTSNAFENPYEPSTDPFSMPTEEPPQLFERKAASIGEGPQSAEAGQTSDNGQMKLADIPPPPANLFEEDNLNSPTDNTSPDQQPPTNNFGGNSSSESDKQAGNPDSPVAAPGEQVTPGQPSLTQASDVSDQTLTSLEQAVRSPHLFQSDNSTLTSLERSVNSPHVYESDHATLSSLEEAAHSPLVEPTPAQNQVDSARAEIDKALGSSSGPSMTPGDLIPPVTENPPATNDQPPAPNQTPPPVAPPLPFNFGN
ncbi:MAG TPA: hypothetical protein VFN51_02265 [Candidatus Saccharimonadales bacterium]|nr:hypothetical protein [Candidatus Saccharimonadales bacterium]